MPTLQDALAEAYASAPAEIVWHTLEFRHPSFTEPLRVVRGFDPVVATLEDDAPVNAGEAVNFQAVAFDFKLPPVEFGGTPMMQIEIDNVSLEIEDQLRLASQSRQRIEVTYRPFLASDPSAPACESPPTFTLRTVKADDLRVSAQAALADMANWTFPTQTYTPGRFPGLVA